MKIFHIGFISCMLTCAALTSCSRDVSAWKGRVELVDGVAVVKNPKAPLYDENVFALKEELTIGEAEGREEYMFSRIVFDVDGQDNIFVLEKDRCEVRLFDALGRFQSSFGGQGEGPGEFQRPSSIQITPLEEIMVYDGANRRLSFFSAQGLFLRHVQSAKALTLTDVQMDSRGHLVGGVMTRGIYRMNRFNLELETIKEFYQIDLSEPGRATFMAPVFHFDLGNNDDIACGFGDLYELLVFDAAGALSRKITREHDRREITEQDRINYIDMVTLGQGLPEGVKGSFPRYHECFKSISIDENGRIFVNIGETIPGTSQYIFDVFDQEGRYICRIPIELIDFRYPLLWKNGKLYVHSTDEAGFRSVKRYQVTWAL